MPEQYFEGVQIVTHEDGSQTHITYEHEPAHEPLTIKETATLLAVTLGATGVIVGAPYAIFSVVEWFESRKEIRRRNKLNKEIFTQMKRTH